MGRPAKCRICGETLDTTIAYKMILNGKPAYYCSKEEYDNYVAGKEKAKQDKAKVIQLITEIFGYNVQNTLLYAEQKKWLQLADNAKIASYLEENKENISRIMNKNFSSEYGSIKYFSAILCNNLKDFRPIESSNQIFQHIPDEHYETKYKNKVRIALEDLEAECYE